MKEADKVELEQEKFVDNINEKLSDEKIVEFFIKTEDDALKYEFQGQFFPSYHYEIKRIYSTIMKKVDEKTKSQFFFHTLRLGEIYPSLNKKMGLS